MPSAMNNNNLVSGGNFLSIQIMENFIFFSMLDEDENELVHCVKRKGSEKEDFLGIKKFETLD